MMITHEISRLVEFGEKHNLIEARDRSYCANLLLDVFQLFAYEEETIREEELDLDDILETMLQYGVANKLIEDTITNRDLFDTRIMNCIMPRPSLVSAKFWELYKDSPVVATKYYYDLSMVSNYVRKTRVQKDMKWKAKSKYGEFDITINLSKPEKDPKEIAMMKNMKSSSYPKCPICKENEGFAGDLKHAPRQTLRLIPLQLHKESWYLQYSPYVYYNEHCIILNSVHKPMKINRVTFSNLLEFLTIFPHYFIGSNADLPIVGGSILSHDHYQGGCYKLPMEDATILKEYQLSQYPNIQVTHLNWPLTTIRLQSEQTDDLVNCAQYILDTWKSYSDESVGILANSNEEEHNTITPIARYKDGQYQIDLALRNNRTSEEHPLGIFHPHQDVHHIKKENIGLIEVMGLAILPARLETELKLIVKTLNNEMVSEEEKKSIEKHEDWIDQLKGKISPLNSNNLLEFLKSEVSIKFEKALEDSGVFKLNEEGRVAFERFMNTL